MMLRVISIAIVVVGASGNDEPICLASGAVLPGSALMDECSGDCENGPS